MNLVSDNHAHQSSSIIESDLPIQQQFLRFQLQPGLIASLTKPLLWSVEIDRVTELVNILTDRVVPMPNLPPTVMGVYNWRGEILWIVDLAMLLGIVRSPRKYRTLQPTIILTGTGNNTFGSGSYLDHQQQNTIGLVVDEIAEIEWCKLDLIQSPVPANIHPELSKWARGLWTSATDEKILILDGEAIVDCADFHADV